MVKVIPLNDTLKEDFERLFCEYYKELDCEDDAKHLVDEYILPDLLAGLIKIDVLFDEQKFSGFVIYQVDDIDNEWNEKEGWGDIREIYVAPTSRGQGLGKFLLYTAEMKLRESGVDKAYCLPEERSEKFFISCGYIKTSNYSPELNCYIYTKSPLLNKCKG